MQTTEIAPTLTLLFRELAYGAAPDNAFVLNPGDAGLVAALERLSADEASASVAGGATVAAHVKHVEYGLSLLLRWSRGENPYADADWAAAWQTSRVSNAEWAALRRQLRDTLGRVEAVFATPREVSDVELNGLVGAVVHLAYHLGAMRQIAPGMRGPKAS
jgi:hypothetical protein